MGIRVLIKGLDKVIEFPTNTKLPDIENSIKVNWNEVESLTGLPMDKASRMERANRLGFVAGVAGVAAMGASDDAEAGALSKGLRKTAKADYMKSQLPSKQVKRLPENIKDLRKDVAGKREERKHAKPRNQLPLKTRLSRLKDSKLIDNKKDRLLNSDNSKFWTNADKKRIESQIDIDGSPGFEVVQANLGAVNRKLKSDGWELSHKSTEGGRASSLYFKKDGKTIRVSNHELPNTAQREYNRSIGHGGGWDEEIIIGKDFKFSDMLESLPSTKGAVTGGALGLLGLGGLLQPQSAEAKAKANEQPYKEGEPLFTADQAKGALDVLATVGSGLLGMSVGGITGIVTGDAGAIDPVSKAFIREPSTDEGKEIIQKLMPILGSVDAVNQFLSKTVGDAANKAGSNISPEVGAAAGAGARALTEIFSPI